MRYLIRLVLWLVTGATAFAADVATKAAPHPLIVNHYAHVAPIVLVLLAACLCGLALLYSNMLAAGTGLMFGALCGNGGQLLIFGYASDWLPIGGWLTNLADIEGGLGLIWSFVGYLQLRRSRLAGK